MDRTDVAVVLGTLALVPAIYSGACPPLSTVRAERDEHGNIAAGAASATVMASAMVLAVSAGLRSWPVALYGGAVVLAYAALYSHARNLP
jgi:hypothetical protein